MEEKKGAAAPETKKTEKIKPMKLFDLNLENLANLEVYEVSHGTDIISVKSMHESIDSFEEIPDPENEII